MAELYINPPTLHQLMDRYIDRIEGLGLSYEINSSGRSVAPEAMAEQSRNAVAIVAGLESYQSSFFEDARNLTTLAKFGVGYDNIDVEAAQQRGVAVSVTTGSNAQSVADYTIAAILSLVCRLPQRHHCVLQGHWVRSSHPSFDDITLGIVGYGRIGSRVAKRARQFGWRVLAVDPKFDSVEQLPDADALLSLEEIVGQVDVLTLHYPKSSDTADLGPGELAKMRPGSILVNMARGGLVDDVALASSIREGHLSGAAIDVFSSEPPTDLGHWDGLPNVLLSPHVAGSSMGALETGFEMCLEVIEYRHGLRKEAPRATFL